MNNKTFAPCNHPNGGYYVYFCKIRLPFNMCFSTIFYTCAPFDETAEAGDRHKIQRSHINENLSSIGSRAC